MRVNLTQGHAGVTPSSLSIMTLDAHPILRPTRCVLIPAVGHKAQELALHCVDPGDIGRDEVIAAALVGQHLKLAAGESRGGAAPPKKEERPQTPPSPPAPPPPPPPPGPPPLSTSIHPTSVHRP